MYLHTHTHTHTHIYIYTISLFCCKSGLCLGAAKSVPLASQPLLLVPFTAEDGEEFVFACCERPALVRLSLQLILVLLVLASVKL